MEEKKAVLDIILHGDIFKEINAVYEEEQARMSAGDKMLYSKMADIYMEIFKCNDRIKLIKAECLGSWVIDDNNVVIDWEIDGCEIEFWYEQYWDSLDITMRGNYGEHTAVELVRAFENYFKRRFTYKLSWIPAKEPGQKGYGGYERCIIEIFE